MENPKPIQRVEDTLLDIQKKLDCMKVDVGCIKSDLKIILNKLDEDTILKHQVEKQGELERGWFFTY
tara:strand:- start:4093 stop:4293 length:201 start_codon:yes stop_codon:yes gene_type:complete